MTPLNRGIMEPPVVIRTYKSKQDGSIDLWKDTWDIHILPRHGGDWLRKEIDKIKDTLENPDKITVRPEDGPDTAIYQRLFSDFLARNPRQVMIVAVETKRCFIKTIWVKEKYKTGHILFERQI